MIPTLLLIGLVLGVVGYRHPIWAAAVGLGLAVLWAVAVASADEATPASMAGGFTIAAANLGATAGIAYGLRVLGGRVTSPARRRGQSSA